MTARDKKTLKILCVLGPVLLLAVLYGYNDYQTGEAKRAAKRKKAREQQQRQQAVAGNEARPNAAGAGTRALPSPPPGATPADNHVRVPSAASFPGIHMMVDAAAQARRMELPWRRDPFAPPDTLGPKITPPGDLESPRGQQTITLTVHISDRAAGNSGTHSARLAYGEAEPFDEHAVDGKRPADSNGDGNWTFVFPAPQEKPFRCRITAQDNGRLGSASRSDVFSIVPPPRERVQIGGRNLVLRGISWAGDSGVALINDDVLGVGEVLHGYEVVKIVKTGVVLKRGEQEIFLQLKE